MKLSPGQVIEIDRKKYFKYIKPLGSGGTGDAHLFQDETTDMKFAIKKYVPKGSNDIKENYDRFVDEIKILFNLSHPNIVRVYNHYLYPERKSGFLQMEYVEGVNINEFECYNKDWNEIFVETIKAFKYLEENKILHRDIKPSNIMIDNNETVKIIDFGFGKKLDLGEFDGKSVLLNWQVAQLPQEIVEQQKYNIQSEIYFLGNLFNNLSKLKADNSFKYHYIIYNMIKVNYADRYDSFENILLEINDYEYENTYFTPKQKEIYNDFIYALTKPISYFNSKVKFRNNINSVSDKLKKMIKLCTIETFIPDIKLLIECFVDGDYTYLSNNNTRMKTVIDFYKFINSISVDKQQIVLNSIITRLTAISVYHDGINEELPF